VAAAALTSKQHSTLEPARRQRRRQCVAAACPHGLRGAFEMLKIQVGHSYFLSYDRKQWERGKPYPQADGA